MKNAAPTVRRPGRMQFLVWSLKHYHQKGLDAAIRYVEESFRRFKNPDPSRYLGYLAIYDGEFRNQGNSRLALRDRVQIDIGHRIMIGGEVGRVDLVPSGGYAVWLFRERWDDSWRLELRMPLIQRFYSDKLKSPLCDVSIGVYSFESGQYQATQFGDLEAATATREARRLGSVLSR